MFDLGFENALPRLLTALVGLTSVGILAGCGSGDDAGASSYGPGSFVGTMSGSSVDGLVSGTFWLEFDADWNRLSGNMSQQDESGDPATVSLSGTFTQTLEEDGTVLRGFAVRGGTLSGEGVLVGEPGGSFGRVIIDLTGAREERCTLQGIPAADGAQFFCGRYSGEATGTWNFALVNGRVSGTFAGDYDGTITGSRDGAQVSLDWSTFGAGGTASGRIAGTGIAGSWQGGGLAGTWTTDSTACPPPPAPPPPPRD